VAARQELTGAVGYVIEPPTLSLPPRPLIPLASRRFERDLHHIIQTLDNRLRVMRRKAPCREFTDFHFEQIVSLIDPRRAMLAKLDDERA